MQLKRILNKSFQFDYECDDISNILIYRLVQKSGHTGHLMLQSCFRVEGSHFE
jgi:hypothetical protein